MTSKKTKRTYRLRNWSEYNRSLVNRGSLTVWVSADVIASWNTQAKSGKRGHPQTYTDTAILCMASLQELYHLPLRATQGLLSSVVELLRVIVTVPCYTTLCRRRRKLEVTLPKRARSVPLHLVVDSTGVKIYGEGEWKVRQHGWTRRRTWRKLHVGVDEATGEILAAVVSTNNYGDGQVLADLLAQVEGELSQVTGDGGYDDRQCYDAIRARGARAVIPPQKGARIWQHGNSKQERHARDENVRGIRRHGRAKWKRESQYHRRSLAETTMFRLKMIFGERVAARSFDGQAAQMLVRCAVLNRITHLGMPQSYAV